MSTMTRREFGVRISIGILASGSALLIALLANNAYGQTIALESLVLKPGKAMPKPYTASGKNISPPLVWRNLPTHTMELALIFEDIDEPKVHWLIYRIPASLPGLPEGLPQEEVVAHPPRLSGMIQGLTGFKQGGVGYRGPDPPQGKEHRFRFTLYALNAKLGLLPGLDKESLLTLIRNHIIGEGQLLVTNRR